MNQDNDQNETIALAYSNLARAKLNYAIALKNFEDAWKHVFEQEEKLMELTKKLAF